MSHYISVLMKQNNIIKNMHLNEYYAPTSMPTTFPENNKTEFPVTIILIIVFFSLFWISIFAEIMLIFYIKLKSKKEEKIEVNLDENLSQIAV